MHRLETTCGCCGSWRLNSDCKLGSKHLLSHCTALPEHCTVQHSSTGVTLLTAEEEKTRSGPELRAYMHFPR